MTRPEDRDEATQQPGEAPLLLRMEEAARRLGVGRTLMYALVSEGEIESVPVGRLRRIPAECLDEYVQRLREQERHNRDRAA